MVLRVDSARHTVLVSHAAVPKLMPAMVMPFTVARPSLLDHVRPGSRVTIRLNVTPKRSIVDRIDLNGETFGEIRVERPKEALAIGDPVPDFVLTDQTGSEFRLSDTRGKVVAVQFLYTRCPLPEVCPRLAASFASLQRRFRDVIPTDLLLLSITLDPQFDTPAVLAEYATRTRAVPPGWRFLTGDIELVARRFGLIHWAEEGVIVHSSQTAIIGRDGRLAAVVDGSLYRLEQLGDLVSWNLSREDKR